MRNLTILMALLAALLVSSPSQAQGTVQGFAFERYDSRSNAQSPHIRLVLADYLTKSLEARLTLSTVGPMPIFSYAELVWHQPTKAVDELRFGRQFPPMGNEWFAYGPHQVPATTFSSIFDPLAAIDTGISAAGHQGKLKWWTGLFAGDRVFGNAPAWRGGPDWYGRLVYAPSPHLSLGGSQRIGLIPATGADVQWTSGRVKLTVETIGSEGQFQEYAQAEYRLNSRLSLVTRYQWLTAGDRWGLGGSYNLGKHAELKLFRETNPSQFFVLGAIRW